MSLLVVNGGAIYATATTTATPIKFEEPPTELVIGQPFTLQLAVQGSQEHQVMVAIPEALTVDQTKTRQANRASLAELDFDADNRKLTLTPSDPTASTTFDLVLSASEAKTYKVTAEALITGPALATTTASAVASSEKTTTHTMTAEPITFTVAAGSAVDSPPEEAGTESAREVSNDAESTSSASQDPTTDDSSATATQAATTKRDDYNATSKSSEQSSSTTATSDPTADNDTATSRTAQADSEVERTPKATKATATKAANDITTAAIVVNPDGSTTVSTYDDLKSAYTNTAVTTIKLGANITYTSTSATELGTRTTSLTIDGQNHSLDLGIGNFTLGSTTTAQTMTVKNFSSIRGAIASGTSSGGAAGIIQSGTDGGG